MKFCITVEFELSDWLERELKTEDDLHTEIIDMFQDEHRGVAAYDTVSTRGLIRVA